MLIAGCYAMGAALSGGLAVFGLTNFPNDRRGEWGPIVLPLVALLALLFGGAGFWILRRLDSPSRVEIGLGSVIAVIGSFAWITWQFSRHAV